MKSRILKIGNLIKICPGEGKDYSQNLQHFYQCKEGRISVVLTAELLTNATNYEELGE
jgi:hypothetical protein